MAQQIVNVGTEANDRTGDDWRTAFIKTVSNISELYAALGSTVYVSSEADFPTQDGTTITLEQNTVYVLGASFTVAKHFVCQTGSSITGWSQNGYTLTYSGTGSMFEITDASFYIHDINVSCPLAQVYNAADSLGGVHTFKSQSVEISGAAKWGTFDDLRIIIVDSCGAPGVDDGISFAGSSMVGVLMSNSGMQSTSASFKGIDLDSASIPFMDLASLRMFAPAGAYGISGLASNGNIPSGSIADVTGCAFLGGMTDLENITVDDVRWNFTKNNPTEDTNPVAMASVNGNSTETVIAAVNTPVKAVGVATIEASSFFTVDTSLKATYIGERQKAFLIDINATIESASGTNKDISIYLAKDGTVIANSAKTNRVGSGDPKNTTVFWTVDLVETENIEVYVENNSDAVNLIVTDAVLRAH